MNQQTQEPGSSGPSQDVVSNSAAAENPAPEEMALPGANGGDCVAADGDDILDDTPAFIQPGDDYEEVKVDDDDVPMDEDNDDDDAMLEEGEGGIPSAAAATPGTARPQIEDMSVVQIKSHTGPVYAVAASALGISSTNGNNGGLLILSGGGDDRAFMHHLPVSGSAEQAQTTRTHALEKHTDSVSSVALNLPYVGDDLTKTPKMAAVASYDGVIAIYDSTTGTKLQTLEGPTDVECLAFHNKGGIVLLAGSAADGSLWMFHLVLRKCLQVFVGHQSAVTACDFTPDGKFALSASSDGTLRMWAPRTGNCKHVFQFPSSTGHQQPAAGLTCMAVNGGADGQLVMVGAEDGMAHVCHTGTKKVVLSLRHYEAPTNVSTSADDGDDIELPMSVEAVAFCPSAPNWCATGGVDQCLKIWDMNTGQCRHGCRVEDNGGGITRLAWHPTLPVVFTSTTAGTVCVWDGRNGQLLKQYSGHTDVINDMSVDFVGDAKKPIVVTGSDDNSVRVFDVDLSALLQ